MGLLEPRFRLPPPCTLRLERRRRGVLVTGGSSPPPRASSAHGSKEAASGSWPTLGIGRAPRSTRSLCRRPPPSSGCQEQHLAAEGGTAAPVSVRPGPLSGRRRCSCKYLTCHLYQNTSFTETEHTTHSGGTPLASRFLVVQTGEVSSPIV
ncbi:unnamed protein product [Caretta caretta]